MRSSHIKVDLLSYERKTADKQQPNDWRAKKIFDGKPYNSRINLFIPFETCMYVLTGCPLLLYPWKRTAATGPRRKVFHRSPIFSTSRANLAGDTSLAVRQPTLLHGTKVGLRNHEEVSTNPGPFTIAPSWNHTGDPPPLHKKEKSPNPLPEGPIASCEFASFAGS